MRKLSSISLAVLIALGLGAVGAPSLSQARIAVSVGIGYPPPALPIYRQPRIPGYGFIWTPGYWLWDDDDGDYFWVPGAWVRPPQIGYYWTPGYWGYRGGYYEFYDGYWGSNIGYYGGVDYGFGYNGNGYEGGYWRGREFYYNRSVNNISNTNITTIYNRTVINNTTINNISYNGGPGGLRVQPSRSQLIMSGRPHVALTPVQVQHVQMARSIPVLRAGANHGAPPIAATSQATRMRGPDIVAARAGAPYHRPMADLRGRRGQNSAAPPANAITGPRPVMAPSDHASRPSAGPPYRSDTARAAARAQGGDSRRPPAQVGQGSSPPRYQNPARQNAAPHDRPAQDFRAPPRAPPRVREAPQARPARQFREPPQARPAQQYREPPQARPTPQFRETPQGRPTPQPRPAPQSRPAKQDRPDGGG